MIAKAIEPEVFRRVAYNRSFEHNGTLYKLNNYPYLDIVLTDACPHKCRFCIAHLVHNKANLDHKTMLEKVKFAVDKMGVREVLLLGGEPTSSRNLLPIIKDLRDFGLGILNKICMTTNGERLAKDDKFLRAIVTSGLTHINLSLMTFDKEKQLETAQTDTYVSREDVLRIGAACQQNFVHLRINTNSWRGNNDTVDSFLSFYSDLAEILPSKISSVKLSPLLKTDSFSVVDVVTSWVREHILPDDEYDTLFHEIEAHFFDSPIVRNTRTLGFVENSMILLPIPIILNYNQHGQLRHNLVHLKEINSLKLLPTGELSLSWNREEADWFINTSVKE